ncbi:MAG: diguanylate cyclase response regulator [Acidobacteria bacterium]|nr:MAG: diguanylate cyclase response regulator [Acidobacteriota bacterium]
MSDNHYKILVADDGEDNLGLLREWLSSQDYYVRCARDGREALELARQDPPDLILLDKVMPEVDGLSVARQLKKEERFSSVPIIVLTGREDTRRHAIFDEIGADDLLTKPLVYEEVETRVRTMLKKREVFRALERANEELRHANERMARLIQFDEKTHLYNYRHFMERLADEFKRARRYGNPLTLAIFDIDHFKSVNDRYGHVAGDEALRDFGQIMVHSARETDLIARYGGEEFTSLLPQTTAAQGQRLADRVRRTTAGHDFLGPGRSDPIRITVSAGVATFPINDRIQKPEELVQAADMALYRAKEAGRNRTYVDQRSLPEAR